ncbi:MAG: Stp1/IreP family PP2C-type Ser/Thr phosphatase [Clostridia bacterium]|nr:Stp1/IreP family PP2C-type Ser/Thr phosphatase [Clostridia bacterium]
MKVFCATDVGCVRTLNEDTYYMPQQGESFVAVADGMGGHKAGEVASSMAIRMLKEILSAEKTVSEDRMRYAFGKANREVYLESEKDASKKGMGTTMTALWFSEDTVVLGHVGDSRAYRMREGNLMRASTDHSYVEELVKIGAITPEMARTHPQRNVITRSIGPWPRVEADVSTFDLQKGDIWLLCSDGLTMYLEDDVIKKTLISDTPIQEKVSTLIRMALDAGGADNVTVLIAAVGECEGDE